MLLKSLKAIKTKLLKSQPENQEEFEKIQNKLDAVELEMLIQQNMEHIPNIN